MRGTMVSQSTAAFLVPAQSISTRITRSRPLADDKTYKAEYLGSGTFKISKPKRKKAKQRQSQLKNPQRGARK
jgi:hypothetical protein